MDLDSLQAAITPAPGSFANGQMTVALVAFIVAFFSYRHSRRSYLQKNALDCQRRILSDKDIKDAFAVLASRQRAKETGHAFISWADVAADGTCREFVAITTLLNNFEDVAVGIRLGMFDEEVLRATLFAMLMRLFTVSHDFIQLRRVKHPTVYGNLHWLWLRWRVFEDRVDPGKVRRAKLAQRALERALQDI